MRWRIYISYKLFAGAPTFSPGKTAAAQSAGGAWVHFLGASPCGAPGIRSNSQGAFIAAKAVCKGMPERNAREMSTPTRD